MPVQAVAIVTRDPQGNVLPGIAGKLKVAVGSLSIITNKDGYDEFDQVPVPFSGLLTLQANDTNGVLYQVPITIPNVPEVTIRVGGSKVKETDILLEPCVPFV